MALQLRRIMGTGRLRENVFSTCSLFPPVMYHFKVPQNFSNACVVCSPFANRLKYGKPVRLRITCSSEHILDGHQEGNFCRLSRLKVGNAITTKHRGSTFGYRVGVTSRCFSLYSTAKCQSRINSKDVSENSVTGHEKVKSSLFQIFQKTQRQTKSSPLCSRIHGDVAIAETTTMSSPNVAVISLDMKSGARKASKADGTVNTKTSGEKVKQKVRKKPIGTTDRTKNGEQLTPKVRKKQVATNHDRKTRQAKSPVDASDTQQPTNNKLDLLTAESPLSGELNSKSKRVSGGKKNNASNRSIASKQSSSARASKPGEWELRSLHPPLGKSVVVVESVAKAKTIQNYLGDMFEVLPSYGHVRDLAGRSGSVRPDDDFSMVWEVPAAAWTHLKSIKVALSGAENLVLALDPDREGEAIAWHIIEMLQQQDALNENVNVARVVFHEVTEAAIKSALQSPRHVDANLVNAYLARRALDYLIGFSISPLLWKKLPGCQSAGRVQSAALALICDREMEIDQFKPQQYWTIEVKFGISGHTSLNSVPILSQLTYFKSKKLDQLSISTHEQADEISKRLSVSEFRVLASKTSKLQRNPPMPYITSTLQQDSANKLHFPVQYTMKLAQKLYEGVKLSDAEATGLITYMRTDGQHISDEAARDVHSLVVERYGEKFAAKNIRKYFKKVKNAQEAHEAIRPTSIRRLPSSLVGMIDEDSLKLYTLIWVRTMACQMEASTISLVQVDFANAERDVTLHSSASRVELLGFQAVYQDNEGALHHVEEETNDHEAFKHLRALKVNDPVVLVAIVLGKHHTNPPSRYSEGSLVKKLEELGIGRPSTYAPIIKVLKDRSYVVIKNRMLIPEIRGRLVSTFLSHHFSEVADYSFTADMENELDNVSAGTTEWKGLLKDYWSRFSRLCQLASSVNIRQVEKMLEETLGHIFFSSLPDKSRTCPSCSEGTLILKVSRFGAGYFIACNQHPKCKHIAGSVFNEDEESVPSEKPELCFQPKLLGLSPNSNEKVFLKNGPYGFYVQLGEDRKGSPPKRASVEAKDADSMTVDDAMELLRYPLTLGNHPEDKQPVVLKHSKFGFSVRHRRTIAPVPKSIDPKKITLEVGLKLLSSKNARHCGRPKNKPKPEDAEEAIWS